MAKLSAIQVRNAKPKDKPYKLTDGHGLFLHITTSGKKTWRYRFRIAGKESRGTRCYLTGTFFTMAEAQAQAGLLPAALTTLAETLALVEQTEERHWEAELYRLQGELLLAQGDEAAAEASLQQALAVARRQQAKMWELRTVTSLARLWQRQRKPDEARQLLAGVYDWFSEGFDTPALVEARTLLDELAG